MPLPRPDLPARVPRNFPEDKAARPVHGGGGIENKFEESILENPEGDLDAFAADKGPLSSPGSELDEGWEEDEAGIDEAGIEESDDSHLGLPVKSHTDTEFDPDIRPQPREESGVLKDMAAIALDAGQFEASHRAGEKAGQKAGQASSTRPGAKPEFMDLSDADIMLRVRDGDDRCFNYLIEKYRRPIMSFMFRMVHNQAVAEELAQEVFLRVYRSRSTYRAEAKFTTWLYRIATNLGVNHARDTKYERTAQNIYLDEPDAETGTVPDLADSTPTIEQDLVRSERFRAIRHHVMALPERQRTAVLMHKYQEMDYKQIGEVLKLSESATKSLLFRAYQTLRDRLKDFV